MRLWARRQRPLAPDRQRLLVVGERANRFGRLVGQLAEAGVAVLAADHPELPDCHGRALLAACYSAAAPSGRSNWAASVDPAIATVLLAPPDRASATASK